MEKNSERAISWADTSSDAARVAFSLVESVKEKTQEKYDEYMSELIIWFEEDDVENRLNYLWAWSLAVKLLNNAPYTTPKKIENKIKKISIGTYLDKYPLKFNYHFQKVKGQFNEKFRKDYFR